MRAVTMHLDSRYNNQNAKQPSWTERYRLGVALNRQMEPVCTLAQVASELGITRQNAYTESVLALGTLAHRLRGRFSRGLG